MEPSAPPKQLTESTTEVTTTVLDGSITKMVKSATQALLSVT